MRSPTSANIKVLKLWLSLTGCCLLTNKGSARPGQPRLIWHDVHAGACSGEPSEGDESVAALLLRLWDPSSGRPLPRARLWSELSVRRSARSHCTLAPIP